MNLEVAYVFIATIRPWWLSIGNTSWNNALDMQESNQTKNFSRNVSEGSKDSKVLSHCIKMLHIHPDSNSNNVHYSELHQGTH